jgi:hypothetical protein
MSGAQAGLYTSMAGWDIGNSILGGASSVSNKWLMYQKAGIFGNQPSGLIGGAPEGVMG